jgi:mono/diheme cytochrome c family protein
MRLPVLVIMTVWVTAALSSAQVRKTVEPDRHWVAPAREDARTNPLANQPDAAQGGARAFHQRCSHCHGEDARGTSLAPDLTGHRVQSQNDGALFWKITSGDTRRGMPGFSFLPELQRWQLVLHLRAHSRAHQQSAEAGVPRF